MWRKKNRPWDEITLRQVFFGKGPPGPMSARRFYAKQGLWIIILGTPFLLYMAYAESFISPGYEPLHKMGFWRYCARLFFLDRHINFPGLLSIIVVLIAVPWPGAVTNLLARIGRKNRRWRTYGGFATTNGKKQFIWFFAIMALTFLCITGLTLGPLALYCQLSWGGFFTQTAGRLGGYLVFSSFLLEGARRRWQRNLADPYGTKWSFGQFAIIVLAWIAVLSIPVLFWFVGHSISRAVAATHENPYVVQIRKYELSGRANYDPKIMCRIGEFYEKGEGVSRNYQKAMQWYKHADASGYYPAAMVDIGLLYQHGLGVPRNYRMALNWYRLGVNARSARAMFYLGMLYDHGDGVARNRATAVKWWRKAARAGSPAAKRLLEKLRIDIY